MAATPRFSTSFTLSRSTFLLSAVLWAACSSDDSSSNTETRSAQVARQATWAASPQDYNERFPGGVFPPPPPLSFAQQSVRQVLRVSAAGSDVRVRLSNRFGAAPLRIAGAHVARSSGGSSIDAASDTPLRFAGQTQVTIPVSEEIWSDPAPLTATADADLALTLYFDSETPVSTVHSAAQQNAYVTPGDALGSQLFTDFETRTAYYWVTGVDVSGASNGAAAGDVIVAFGDSITDGVGSTAGANQRYPNLLSARLHGDPALQNTSIVNAGISGNRVLSDVIGPSGISRFARDVLQQPGASHVIILLGINDIGFSGIAPDQAVSATQITDGLSQMVNLAKQQDLKVYLATLLPFKGTMPPYYGESGETLRGIVNTWIRSNQDIDGVIDFDRATQDSTDALIMNATYDSGDHLHPNDAGYQRMATSIDLALFR
jgi:lysophospholipase L1-like esterase